MGLDDPNPSAEELSAWKRHAGLLETSDPDEHFRFLEQLMNAASGDARDFAAQEASRRLDIRAIPAITRALHDHDFAVRQSCTTILDALLERGDGDPAFRTSLADTIEQSVRAAPHQVFGLELACLGRIDRDRAVRLCVESMSTENAPPAEGAVLTRILHANASVTPLATLRATLANAKARAREGRERSAMAAWTHALLGLAFTEASEFEQEVAEAERTPADALFHGDAARALLTRHRLGTPSRPELYRSADHAPPGPAKLVGALLDLSGTLQSDGAWGYLAQTKPRRRRFALRALRTVNAPATADLIRRAASLHGRSLNLFAAAFALLWPRAASQELHEIDRRLWADDDALFIKVARYILENRSHFPHLETGGVPTAFQK